MQTEKILMATSILAAAALSRFRCVNFAGATAVATDAVLGVPNADYAVGEQAGVSTHGEILVEAGAAIAAGAQVPATRIDGGITHGVLVMDAFVFGDAAEAVAA